MDFFSQRNWKLILYYFVEKDIALHLKKNLIPVTDDQNVWMWGNSKELKLFYLQGNLLSRITTSSKPKADDEANQWKV